MTVVFIFCWIPYHVVHYKSAIRMRTQESGGPRPGPDELLNWAIFNVVAKALIFISSSCNPFIYGLSSRNFSKSHITEAQLSPSHMSVIQSQTADTQSQTADTQSQTADTQSQTADTQLQTADTQSQTADTQSQTADTQSQTADTQSQTADTQSQTADTQSQTASVRSHSKQHSASYRSVRLIK